MTVCCSGVVPVTTSVLLALACGGLVDDGQPNASAPGGPGGAPAAGGAANGADGNPAVGRDGSTADCPAIGGSAPDDNASAGGFGAAFGSYKDAPGDVPRAGADVLEAAAWVADGFIDFRVRFADHPLQADLGATLSWCFDFSHNDLGPGCSSSTGDLDGWLVLSYQPSASSAYSLSVFGVERDPCQHVAYDRCRATLRILLPSSALPGTGFFAYVLLSDWEGSGGKPDVVPDPPTETMNGIYPAFLPDFGASFSCDPPL
jgi:hypothetical protein